MLEINDIIVVISENSSGPSDVVFDMATVSITLLLPLVEVSVAFSGNAIGGRTVFDVVDGAAEEDVSPVVEELDVVVELVPDVVEVTGDDEDDEVDAVEVLDGLLLEGDEEVEVDVDPVVVEVGLISGRP